MMTNVSIYSESPQSKSDLSTSGTKGAFLIDDKLSKFLSSVNKKDVSKVVDDNGEPLVVYHGTNEYEVKKTWNDISKNGRLELKNKALACIGEIIENGIPLNLSRDWKGKGHQTFILSAPIKIAEDMCVASVVIKRPRAEKHRDGTEIFNEPIAYIIDAIKIERLVDKINPVGQLNAMGIDVNKSTNLIDDVLQNIWNVKQKDVSKVVDDNGDQEAYKQAVELAKAEAERKGYAVEVYHGTGADGFNVAKADSSEQQNGEGNQAHGAGLYMAVSRDTAEGYRDKAVANAKRRIKKSF